jgi:hypothetical protein
MVARVASRRRTVATEVRAPAFARYELEADNRRGEINRTVEIACADADVADVVEVNHTAYLRPHT